MTLTYEQFKHEIDQAHQAVLEYVAPIVDELGVSDALKAYIQSLKGYPRTLYNLLLWVPDRQQRRELGIAIGLHAVGVKLIDDIMDGDQDLPVHEQVMGVPLLLEAEALFAQQPQAGRLLRHLANDHRTLWRGQLHEKNQPPQTLEDWVENARIKSGLFLASYATLACYAAGAEARIGPARRFAEAFGLLYMIGDDWVDYTETNEQIANVAYLLSTGKVRYADLTARIRSWQEQAIEAVAESDPICDMRPFLTHFAAKLIDMFGQIAPTA